MADSQRINGNGAKQNRRFSIQEAESDFGRCLFARVMGEVYRHNKIAAGLADDLEKTARPITTRAVEFWLSGAVEPPWWDIMELLQRKMREEFRRNRIARTNGER